MVPPAPTAADRTVVRTGYVIGVILVAALVALPASAMAAKSRQTPSLAAQRCAQERASIGKRTFRKRYGTKHTMRTCIRRNRGKAAQALTAATEECQQELAQDGPDQFILDWAWDEDTVENAMSECVADALDTILDPDDSSDDGADDEE
jgi:hypothetical protein